MTGRPINCCSWHINIELNGGKSGLVICVLSIRTGLLNVIIVAKRTETQEDTQQANTMQKRGHEGHKQAKPTMKVKAEVRTDEQANNMRWVEKDKVNTQANM